MNCVNCQCEHTHHCPKGLNVMNHVRLVQLIVNRRYAGRNPQDMVQDALLRLLETRNKYDPMLGKETVWVFYAVMNVLEKETRCWASKAKALSFDRGSIHPQFRQIENKDHVDFLISKLESDYQRQVLHMLFYENLTREEAAKRLGVPVSTVMSRRQSAMNILRCF